MKSIVLLLAVVAQDADLTYAPPIRKPPSDCTCPANVRSDVVFSGYVVDAEMRLAADKLSVEDRMATVFDVKESNDGDVSGRTRVWHDVSEAKCGVSFDYGKKYTVAARRNDEGELETDQCLTRR